MESLDDPQPAQKKSSQLVWPVLLALGVALIYAQTLRHAFVNLDDPGYVYQNVMVRRGLNGAGVLWAMTSLAMSNWHPLTWMSYMLDWRLHGESAGGFHLTNVLLHGINTLLLFWILRAMTGAAGRSAFAAALFALHPLRVESVAWIAERKDVLSGLFWLLSMAAYWWYARKPGIWRMALTSFAMLLGVLSKPTLVTLPFALLLLDYWPLGRVRSIGSFARLILEKAPLWALAVFSAAMTIIAQANERSLFSLAEMPLPIRLLSALRAYLLYLAKSFFPHDLSVMYSASAEYSTALLVVALIAALVLGVVTVLSLTNIRRAPFLAVGWFWFLGTLVPMIGLIQVGYQSMADRYTYIPSIGLSILLSWGLFAAAERLKISKRAMVAAAFTLSCVLVVLSWIQTTHWRDSVALFEHAARVGNGRDYRALDLLGNAYLNTGRPDLALQQYRESLAVQSQGKVLGERIARSDTLNNMGRALLQMKRADEALACFTEAVSLVPDNHIARTNLGVAYFEKGMKKEALEELRQAERLEPDYDLVQMNLGWVLHFTGDNTGAIRHFKKAQEVMGDPARAYYALGVVYQAQGRFDHAREEFQKAQRLHPDNEEFARALNE